MTYTTESEKILNQMLKDIREKNKPEYKSLKYYVDMRLDKSIENYYRQLLESKNMLSNFNELSVSKKLLKTF